MLDGRSELIDELLDLYTSRNLYALQTIANKIDAEFRDPALAAVFRLALAACLLPGSRLNGYPGRVASLRISGGHVRQPASRYQREVNVWRLFETAVHDVRTAMAALGRDRRPARFAADLEELGGVGAANVLWIRCRPGGDRAVPAAGRRRPGAVARSPPRRERGRDELRVPGHRPGCIGREAAETLRLEPLFGAAHGSTASRRGDRPAPRHGIGGRRAQAGWLVRVMLIEGDEPDRVLAAAVAGAAAELELVDVIHRESRRSGDGVALHFRKPSAEDRLREAVEATAAAASARTRGT